MQTGFVVHSVDIPINTMVTEHRCQRHRQGLAQPTQPPIDAVDVTRNCPWTRWGILLSQSILLSQFLFKMTPAYVKAITQAQKELNARRLGDSNGDYNPRFEPAPTASAVVHLGSLKAKASDENYCMLDSGANVLVIFWKPGMKGEKTMCTLVGDERQNRGFDCLKAVHSFTCPSYSGRERGLSPLTNFVFSSHCELSSLLETCA